MYGLEDSHLCWQDEKPLEPAMLELIGEVHVDAAFDRAMDKLADEGPPGPDYQRDMREDR